MAEFIEVFAEILKITPDLVDKYAARGPIEASFYLFFFPMLFLIIFVWIIGRTFITRTLKFGLLISLAVLAFIIFQGWYSYFVMLSEFWLYLLVFLGVIYFITARHPGGGGGGGGAKQGIFGSLGDQLGGRTWSKISGQEKDLVRTIESQLRVFNDLNPGQSRDVGMIMQQITQNLQSLREMTQVGGVRVGGEHDKLLRQFEQIARKKHINKDAIIKSTT
jgi:hypothetical protein